METVEKTNFDLAKDKPVDECIRYQQIHTCASFIPLQQEEQNWICQNARICKPMNKALQQEPFITDVGIVVCPYPGQNLAYLIYGKHMEG